MNDDDVISLLVESIMILHCDAIGYHFVNPDGSIPAEIQQATALLEMVLTRGSHPFARHLYIHITEMTVDGALHAVTDGTLFSSTIVNFHSHTRRPLSHPR